MRGEFIGVWAETWREIWLPLIEHQDVPDDLFCEVYRILVPILREPTGHEAIDILTTDAIALREVFREAIRRSGVDIPLAATDDAFANSGATELAEPEARRARIEAAVNDLAGDQFTSCLSEALSAAALAPEKVAAARARATERTLNDPAKSREEFEKIRPEHLRGEAALIDFLETAHSALEELGGDDLTNRYFNLLSAFVEKFSLRYDLRRPLVLCPTIPGLFASLVRDLRALTSGDTHLDALMKDFEETIRDLRIDCSDGRIKTCIQKQVNLLEAIGRAYPGVTGTTLGAICDELGTWPHEKLKLAMKALYGFASDYPGIRHGGSPANALRAVDMRDMVAISILLVGFTPYLSDFLDPIRMYRGG